VIDDHPTTPMFERLLAGTLGDAEMEWAVAHLLRRCEVCLGTLRGARERSYGLDGAAAGAAGTGTAAVSGEGWSGRYDGVLAASFERSAAEAGRIRGEQLAAAALWARLEDAPAARRMELVTGDARFHTWAVASRLLDAAGEFRWRDAGEGLEECRLALAIAERLPAEVYPASLRGDLRARALGGLADMLRREGRVAAAGETMERAWEALDEGSGEGLERAGLLRLEASLLLTLGDGAGAAAGLRRAASLYRLHGDGHQEGRTLQKLALAVGHDDPAQGVEIAERALALVEPGREPRLELAARHLLIWFLNDCGMSWQALELLERSRPLYRGCGESEPLLLLPWLEARICRRLGQLGAAEDGLAEAWHRCRAAGCQQELTLVSLDLAEAWTALGKRRHALRLLGSCMESLRRWRMHAEGLAAWGLVIEAAGGGAGAGGVEGVGGAGAGGGAAGAGVGARRVEVVMREAGRYYRRAWRRAVPFPGRLF
jgi:tetratricopeptide (TPR) repeat protein